jgi:riboflavin synthase
MFTGLIEGVGRIDAVAPTPSGSRLAVGAAWGADLQLGESVSVNGVCLTVAGTADAGFLADVGPETLRVTTVGAWQAGDAVNLERAMRADSRFGGHFVQGHVDAVGAVEDVAADGDSHWLTIRFAAEHRAMLVPKGSVAVDGVSLTVANLDGDRFRVMLIPFTWAHTSLASLRPGGHVNLEFDMVGKYVARAVELFGQTGTR